MPNPYVGNDDAARFVEYYASPRMQRDSVHRLYDRGIQQRIESQRRAEEAVYPSQPKTYRSQKEIDEYVNRMVYGEVFRRQRKLAELEWDLYRPVTTHYFSPADLEAHVRHMYDKQLQKIERRERDRRLRLGIMKMGGEGVMERERRTLQEREINREREEKWRPPSAYMKYNDGQMLLVSELGAIHGDNPPPNAAAATTPNRGRSRSTDPNRLQMLAKPLRVTHKVRKEEELMPPFRVVAGVSKSHSSGR